MPHTAFQHFTEDISRAAHIVAHADPLPQSDKDEQLLRSDLLRSGWMFAVGAMDAYFCDAYTDIVANTLIAKSKYVDMTLPDAVYKIVFPVSAIFTSYSTRDNWKWRMAARQMMERENVISLDTIKSLFNPFLPHGRKFFKDLLLNWMQLHDAEKRVFGISRQAFMGLSSKDKIGKTSPALKRMGERYKEIFQRRHDCIHNCDRPKVSPRPLTKADIVNNVIQDVRFLVSHCDEHIDIEFPNFLHVNNCPNPVIVQTGYSIANIRP